MTSPEPPGSVRPVDYKGEPLDSERGPGLGCFRFQVVLLVILLVLTPLTVAWSWPPFASIVLLFLTLVLLLFAGQTVIFLLRLVAADKREGVRHAPRAATTPTVGQLEDAAEPPTGAAGSTAEPPTGAAGSTAEPPTGAAGSTAEPRGDGPAPAVPASDQPGDPGVRE